MYTSAPGGDPGSSLMGMLMAGSAIYLFFVFASVFIGYYILYRVTKAAVRDGVMEAMRKSGGVASPGFIQGYPPAQAYGAPVAPHIEGNDSR